MNWMDDSDQAVMDARMAVRAFLPKNWTLRMEAELDQAVEAYGRTVALSVLREVSEDTDEDFSWLIEVVEASAPSSPKRL